MPMEEELVNLFQLALKVKKKMENYVIQFANKDFKVLVLYAGKFVLQNLLILEQIALNRAHTVEEQDMFRKNLVRKKILQVVRKTDSYGQFFYLVVSSYITYSTTTTLAGEYTTCYTCLGEYCWSYTGDFTGEVYTVDDYNILNQLEF